MNVTMLTHCFIHFNKHKNVYQNSLFSGNNSLESGRKTGWFS